MFELIFRFYVHFLFPILFSTARLPLRIDCEAITPQERQTEEQDAAAPHTSSQPHVLTATGSGGENGVNGRFPSSQDVLNVIALKYFETVDQSKPEEQNGFLQYLKEVRKVLFVDAQQGSLVITVECHSLRILQELWQDYRSGHLNQVTQEYLVTEDILKELGLIEVKLTTTIVEEEYKAYRQYFLKHPGGYGRRYHMHGFILNFCDEPFQIIIIIIIIIIIL